MNTTRVFRQPVQIRVFGRTDTGRKRSENQDSMLITDLSGAADGGGYTLDANPAPNTAAGELTLGPKGLLLLVADGMGGAAAGGLASGMAVSAIEDEMMKAPSVSSEEESSAFALHLRRALEAANASIHGAAMKDPSLRGMGTTATLAGVLADTAYFAQVGDSRAYIIRHGRAVQVTRDQSVVQALVDAGTMTEEEAERSEQSNRILQALGVAPTIQAVLTYHTLRNDDVILLCSDGLTRVLRKEEIGEMSTRITDVAALCQELIDLGNSRGGPDNITVVAARVTGGLPAAAETETVTRLDYDAARLV